MIYTNITSAVNMIMTFENLYHRRSKTYQVGILLKTDVEFKLFHKRRMGENEKYLREKEQCTLYTDLR